MTINASVFPQLPAPSGAYSHVAIAGGLIFTSGFGPLDAQGEGPEGIGLQTEAALANLEAALRAAGSSMMSVVKVTVHLAEQTRDFAEFDATYRTVFHEPFPVRTTVGSDLGGILIEIDAVAVRDA